MSSDEAPATDQTLGSEKPPPRQRQGLGRAFRDAVLYGNSVVVTVLAIFCALVVGAVLVVVGDEPTRKAMGYFFAAPGDTFRAAGSAIGTAYVALFEGAVFNPGSATSGFSGVMYPISETLVSATPLILAGLSVALAFRTGLFNIGAQGQIIMGAIFAGYVGFAWHLPIVLHLIVALAAGIVGGALWGGIAGFLKARTGAHEVISTIMLNYVAYSLLAFLLAVNGFQAPPYSQAISRNVLDTARLPPLLGSGLRVHAGLILALLAAVGMWWLLERSTTGFELRAVGSNQFAARTAGMSVERSYVLAMLLAGALSGLAGCSQILGTNPAITQDIDGGFGFDAITVALLGRGKPGGTVLAGLLFGALRAGGVQMQSSSGTSIDLVSVVQSVIVLFIAAPALIRAIFRLRAARGGVRQDLAKGWNG
ncbi:MAG TPA: ABC transporter permease [Streptosporangiales bacterium]